MRLVLWKPKAQRITFRYTGASVGLCFHWFDRSLLCPEPLYDCPLCCMVDRRPVVYAAVELSMQTYSPGRASAGELCPAQERTVLVEFGMESWASVLRALDGVPGEEHRRAVVRLTRPSARSHWLLESHRLMETHRPAADQADVLASIAKLYRLPSLPRDATDEASLDALLFSASKRAEMELSRLGVA